MCRSDHSSVTTVNAQNSSESAACDAVTAVTPVEGGSNNRSSADPGADEVTDPLRRRSPPARDKDIHAPNPGDEGRAQDEERW